MGESPGPPPFVDITKLKAERDHWRAECQCAAAERDDLLRLLGSLVEALTAFKVFSFKRGARTQP
jgi:hypothetical protein